jgi:hypothetical protein
VQIVSTGFALNAARLAGQMAEGYLDTGATDQVKVGSLTSDTGLVARPAAATGDVRAIHGTTVSTAGVAVLGSALAESGATEGVRGQSTSPDGRGVVGGAFAASGATVGVFGESQSPDGTGVLGRVTAMAGGTVGVGGESFSTVGTGVAGAARATSGDAWGVYGETASPTGYGVVSIGDFIADGDIYATGTKYFLAEHPGEAASGIQFACLEGGEVGVYQRGVGRLDRGEARIELPDPFPLVAGGSITVQVTPQEESGPLYVPQGSMSPEGFTVREAGGAGSAAAFTYLVFAERAGYEGAEAVRPVSVSEKIVTSPHLSPHQKSALRAALSPEALESISEEGRAAVYAALHQGKFGESCELLGGCGAVVPTPVGPRPADEEQNRRDPDRLGSGATSDLPGGDPELDVDGVALTGPSGREAAGPLAPPASTVPPSWLATRHVVSEAVEAGEVVVLDRLAGGALRPGSEAYDSGVIGVVASLEGRVLPGETAPVAVAGTVPCRVDADYGWIEAGDLLVVSPTPGHAMRADSHVPGTVLGKALESLHKGQGTIRILLTAR